MDTATCREQMKKLIGQESSALGELAGLLEREHGYLSVNDVAALDGAIRQRQQCVARILRVDEERRALCRTLGRPHDLKGLEQLMNWCDPGGTLAGDWAACAAAVSRCRELNDRNGTLVNARLVHVQARLTALIDGRRETITYGPRGTYSVASAGHVLTAAV